MKRILLLFITLCMTSSVYAIGGMVSQSENVTTPEDFFQLRVSLFIDEDTSTITAQMGSLLPAFQTQYAMLYPVPDPDAVIVETTNSHNYAPLVDFENAPPNPCSFIVPSGFGGHGDGGFPPPEADDYTVIAPEEILTYLNDNEFTVTDDMQAVIDDYILEGLHFAVMPLSYESSFDFPSSSRLYDVIYQGDIENVRLPIMLQMASYDISTIPLIDIVIASTSTPYVPSNVDTLRFTNETLRFNNIFDSGRDLGTVNIRTALWQQISNSTRFASIPTLGLIYGGIQSNEGEGDVYVTRWRANSQTFTEDIFFMPDPDFESLTEFELSDRNLIDLYNCTTEGAGAQFNITYEAIADNLPTGHTHIDAYDITIAHPEGWVVSDITTLFPQTFILAPEPVTREETLVAYNNGDPTPPMIQIGWASPPDSLFAVPEMRPEDDHPSPRSRVVPFNIPKGQNIDIRLLTSDEDYQANQAMYDAMLDYAYLRRYMTDLDLPHTLLLSLSPEELPDFETVMPEQMIGYADGWSPAMYQDDLGTLYFIEDATGETITATYEVGFEWMRDGNPFQEDSDLDIDTWLDATTENYSILPEARDQLRQAGADYVCCNSRSEPIPFNNGTERGFYIFTNTTIRLAVPVDSSVSDDLLLQMLASYISYAVVL